MLPQLLANGVVAGCLFALSAVGFALIYNTTRIFHVAHGATYTAAAYICYWFIAGLHWRIPAAVVAAVAFSALLGAAMEWVVYSPLAQKRSSLLVSLLSSLGLYIALVNLLALLAGNQTRILRPGIEVTFWLGGVVLTGVQLAQVGCGLVVLPTLLILLKVSKLGRMIRAVRDDATLATVMGIEQARVRVAVFALGSALAGLSATLAALDVGIEPSSGMPALLIATVSLVIGGVGTFEGAILGALVLGILRSLVIWQASARWTDAVTFAVLIVFLVWRPAGVLGSRKRVEEAAG